MLALARAWLDMRRPRTGRHRQWLPTCRAATPAGVPISRALGRKSTRTRSARSSRHVSAPRATFLSAIDGLGFHASSQQSRVPEKGRWACALIPLFNPAWTLSWLYEPRTELIMSFAAADSEDIVSPTSRHSVSEALTTG
ncbi:hypothetical protein M440DRAFT_1077275 [Trichoderma longibrachiatum ATCC 18648]|uniref:Uncharacterized protein n=1 Tax=Trichoderma longibrachiatum ATCC 18648 TaxID=983965 RepID=A0A2T4BVB8_TRILO|nr:hypothetical protein M440DRAFT_1077275 [Trichoderma longibrachiatum ATCC 18648]